MVRVEHLSFKDRGSPQTPTRHQGPTKTHVLRKQQRRARAAWLIEQATAQRESQAKVSMGLEVSAVWGLQ